MTEVKLDRSTLPKTDQRVVWQTLEDEAHGVWTEGVYHEQDQMFMYQISRVQGEDVFDGFDSAQDVIHWKPNK